MEITIKLTEKQLQEAFDRAMENIEATTGISLMECVKKQMPEKHHHTRVVDVNCKARESLCPSCLGVTITTENEYPKYCTWCG